MDTTILQKLHEEGLISTATVQRVNAANDKAYFAVHREIKMLLYLGVTLLCTGAGVLIYQNINSIGHQVILILLALLCAGSFFYCFKKKLPFSWNRVEAPNSFFDYVLLLACSSFIVLIAYLQYQYNLFGNRYGLATFFPMLVLFFSAYYFDHLGVLSMAIVNLGAWLGLTLTPLQMLEAEEFNSSTIIFTGLGLGLLLLITAIVSNKRGIKKHFEFTYTNFAVHLLFISCLAGMFYFATTYLLWFLLLAVMVYFLYRKSFKDRSFYFIVIITLYAYIGISYLILHLLNQMEDPGMAAVYLGFFYFIASGIFLVMFLIRINKKLKQHDSV